MVSGETFGFMKIKFKKFTFFRFKFYTVKMDHNSFGFIVMFDSASLTILKRHFVLCWGKST